MYNPLKTPNSFTHLLTLYKKHGHLAQIKELLQSGALDEKQGHILLFYAVLNDRLEIVSELLAQGCKVTIDSDGALFRMALQRGNLKIIELLVSHGADLLFFAAKNPDIFRAPANHLCNFVNFLVLGKTNEMRETLHHLKLPQILRYEMMRIAVACSRFEAVEELLSRGFESSLKFVNKASPLEIAVARGDFQMTELLENEKAYLCW